MNLNCDHPYEDSDGNPVSCYECLASKVAELEADAHRFAFIMEHIAAVVSRKMDGQHTWRLRGSWPKMIGPTFRHAVDVAMGEVAKCIGERELTETERVERLRKELSHDDV